MRYVTKLCPIPDCNNGNLLDLAQSPAPCTACPEDTYQLDTDVNICRSCPEFHTTDGSTGQTSLDACKRKSIVSPHYLYFAHSTFISIKMLLYVMELNFSGSCEAGKYSKDGQTCIPCALGSYKDTAGTSVCTYCDLEKTTSGTGSQSIDDCIGM